MAALALQTPPCRSSRSSRWFSVFSWGLLARRRVKNDLVFIVEPDQNSESSSCTEPDQNAESSSCTLTASSTIRSTRSCHSNFNVSGVNIVGTGKNSLSLNGSTRSSSSITRRTTSGLNRRFDDRSHDWSTRKVSGNSRNQSPIHSYTTTHSSLSLLRQLFLPHFGPLPFLGRGIPGDHRKRQRLAVFANGAVLPTKTA